MKIIAQLPEQKHYQLVNQKENLFEFVDRGNDSFRIISPISNPFTKDWVISINPRQNKSDKVRYVVGIIFKLFPISPDNIDTKKGYILRESYKSIIRYSQNATRMFYTAPSKSTNNIWIAYSITLSN